MKKLFLTIGITLGMLGAHSAVAQSTPPLVVVFESEPLFANVDFKPLDSVLRYVRVTNNTNASHPLIIETIHKTGCLVGTYCLAEKLRVKVRLGTIVLYNKTLKEFYDDGQVVVDPALPSGATRQYDIEVTFETGGDDNNYQTLETGFDLLVGFQGADTVSSGGGNGGGGTGIPGLLINNQATVIATSTGGVIILWNTSHAATSQVIYGLTSDGPYSLNLSLPNYGYPNATPEDSTKVVSHAVYISGLIPGEIYNYRVISHASPPTVGYEFQFTVPQTEEFVFSYEGTDVGENLVPISSAQVVADARELFTQPGVEEEELTDGENFATVAGLATNDAFVPQRGGGERSVPLTPETKTLNYLGYVFAILTGLALVVFLRMFVGRRG